MTIQASNRPAARSVRRRHLLLSGAAGGAAALPSPAIAQGARVLVMATAWPDSLPGMADAPRRFAARVAAISGGALRIEVHAAGKLAPALGVLDAVIDGKADIGHATPYYWVDRSPALPFFATVPFGMTADEHFAWLSVGGGQELWDRLYRRFGVKPLPGGNTGAQMGGWLVRELRSVDDLKGLKLRFPGLGGEILKRFGVQPMLLPASELVPAMRDGRLDGLEWIAPWNDLALGIHEVAKNYYFPGFHEPSHCLELTFNLRRWESFDDTTREILRTAAEATHFAMLAEFNTRNAQSLDVLTREHGVAFRRFPNDMLRQVRRIAPDVIRDSVAGDALAVEVHDSYMRSLQAQLRWAEFGDRAYWQARYI